MNNVVKKDKQEVVAQPVQQTSAVLTMIERAASDPNVDVLKMEKLLDMQERVLNKQSESEFFAALNRCQQKTGRISADSDNKQTRSKYASYAALDRVLRPIYTEEGLSLSFGTEPSEREMMHVICDVSHPSGYSKRYSVMMPADGKGAKGGDVMTKTHAAGAAVSYGMRYLLKMIFNVAIGEDDTDGNMPTNEPDCTDWILKIEESASLDDLKANYSEAFQANSTYPHNLSRINAAKDAKKRELVK